MSASGPTLVGLDIDPLTEAEVVQHVIDRLADRRGGWVCPVNLDVLRQCDADAEIKALVAAADLVVPDGAPLLWASQLAGTPLPERVAGSTLILSLTAAAARAGRSVYLLGGNPGTAVAAAEKLRVYDPDLQVAGTRCPPFGFERDPDELAALRQALVDAAPDIIYVGLGFPKQDRLITELRSVLPRAWFISCGISFSFVSGEVRRAPVILQRLGLEWLHRLAQEPRRLARRYLVDGPPFVLRLAATALRARRENRPE